MNNNHTQKIINKYVRENRELGKLFLKVFDFKKQREKRVAPKKENIEEKQYLEQLYRERGESLKGYAKFTEKLKNHPLLKDKISDNLIRYILRDLLFSKHLHEKNVSPEEMGIQIINEIRKEISSYLVIFPLDGFIPDNNFFKLGNVVFGTAKNILEHFNSESENGKTLDIKIFEDSFLRTISVGTLVTTFDKNSALTLAENKINLSLNFIRIFIPIEYNLYRQPKIRISDEIKERFVFPLPFRKTNRIYAERDLNHMAIISGNLLGKFKTVRILEEGNRIFEKESYQLSELDKRILNALGWIGEAIDTNEFYLKVVKSVVGLETLFKLGENKKKDFCKQIIRIFKDSSVDTKEIKKDSGKLYKLRSKIVHGGKRHIREEEAEIAERIASGCLLFILDKRNQLGSDEALFKWLKIDNESKFRLIFKILVKKLKNFIRRH
ncbi:MAG: hypothetical protein JW924_02915 [Fusobacteriaceae bacterium]|nr:hypothetical protein [Fusobacteriaceae bacterium]